MAEGKVFKVLIGFAIPVIIIGIVLVIVGKRNDLERKVSNSLFLTLHIVRSVGTAKGA